MTIEPAQFYKTWFAMRHRARTDLLWLCNEVLEYKDVDGKVHGPIIDSLQKFKGGEEFVHPKTGMWVSYKPACDLWDLEGPRENLWLDPRGHLKTTVITISHKIQWNLNYPDIRILLSMATGDQVVKVMAGVLNHYRFGQKFRFLFPEYCPPAKSAKDFGNMEGFTVPCKKDRTKKEPTFSSASADKTTASAHYEVICNSDLVVEENIKTAAQKAAIKRHFHALYPLLERGGNPPRRGWMDVEGTRYDFDEIYGSIVEEEQKRIEAGQPKRWFISIRKNRVPDDRTGELLWAKRFSHEDFDQMKEDDPYFYAANQQNEPIPEGSGLADRADIQFSPRRVLRSIPMHWHMTLDLASMDTESRGKDDIVFNVHGFDRDGRLNVIEILAGRFKDEEVIDFIFGFCKTFPQIQDIKGEREAYWRTLKPFIMREQDKRKQLLPPFVDIKRDNRTAKKERIGGLRKWFKGGLIRIAEEVTAKSKLIQEVLRFSANSTYPDDILDTLADAFQGRDGTITYDVYPEEEPEMVFKDKDGIPRVVRPHRGVEKFLGFDPSTHMDTWAGDESERYNVDPRTGL